VNLRSVDLNLLVVLQALLAERHVSRAAEQLGMSQSAVSRALSRLRDTFDDPLLVKTPQGYDLSARAQSALPQLDQLLEGARHLIAGPVFEPKSSTQVLRIYGPDPDISRFIPPLFEVMRREAPNMALDVRSDPRDHFELLESGEVHFGFSALQPTAGSGQLRSLKLARSDFAILMSEDNPLAHAPLTKEKYLAASHVMISLTGRGGLIMERNLLDKGHLERGTRLKVPLRLSSFTSLAAFCERSDILAHLPRHFAEGLARGRRLVLRESPEDIEITNKHVHLYWHERFHADPMCIWVREKLKVQHVSKA